MVKVHILTTCEHCKGQAYLPVGEEEDYRGNTYTRYIPCPMCEGNGERPKWVSLVEFVDMLEQVQCRHARVSCQGSMRFSAGDVWDDIVEVCDGCGARLE
jgi:hypothetical protein